MPSSAEAFRAVLIQRLRDAEARGERYLEIRAGELHRDVGGYPGPAHRMPICCSVLYREMNSGDEIVKSPPKGKGASLTIRFALPRKMGPAAQATKYKPLVVARRPVDTTAPSKMQSLPKAGKPVLMVEDLIRGGFELSGQWILSDKGDLKLDRPLPAVVGVYAFAKAGVVVYVGVATMGLAKRLYFYGRPGVSQPTNQRLNKIIKKELLTGSIEIYTAKPTDLEWQGLPVHGSAGLELGLIKKFALPWNMKSAGPVHK